MFWAVCDSSVHNTAVFYGEGFWFSAAPLLQLQAVGRLLLTVHYSLLSIFTVITFIWRLSHPQPKDASLGSSNPIRISARFCKKAEQKGEEDGEIGVEGRETRIVSRAIPNLIRSQSDAQQTHPAF
jgi:hypothetical protein